MNVVGEQIKLDADSPVLGQVTAQETENGITWLEIDCNYQQRASEFDYIIELCKGKHYLRPKNGRWN